MNASRNGSLNPFLIRARFQRERCVTFSPENRLNPFLIRARFQSDMVA